MPDDSGVKVSPVATSLNPPMVRKVEKRQHWKEGHREEEFKELMEESSEEGENLQEEVNEEEKTDSQKLLEGLSILSQMNIVGKVSDES